MENYLTEERETVEDMKRKLQDEIQAGLLKGKEKKRRAN